MADLDLTVTKPAKTKGPSKRIRHCIDLMVSGEANSQKRAAELAGISRERLNRALKEVTTQGYLEQAVKRQLASSQAPAAATLLRLLTEAKSEHVMKDCATTLLAYSGIRANDSRGPLVNIALGAGPGFVVDLRLDQSRAGVSSISEVGGVILDEPATEMRNVTPLRHEGEQ